MRKDLKELTGPLQAKDPNKLAEEKKLRWGLVRERLGINDEDSDSETLEALKNAIFMQTDRRGGAKGPRINTSINNLKLMLKISFRRKSGRARNLEEAAQHYGVTNSKFKKLRENHKNRWRDIQNHNSKLGEEDIKYRKKCKDNLSEVIKSLENLVAERKELIRQKDSLTAHETDQIDLKVEEIFLIDYLIGELEKSHRHFCDESKIGLEARVIKMIDQISVSTENNDTILS